MARCGEPLCATMAIDGSSNAATSNSYSNGVLVDTAEGARAELQDPTCVAQTVRHYNVTR